MECLLPYISMVDVPHKMVGLERMLDYRCVGLERFHCTMLHCTMLFKLKMWDVLEFSRCTQGTNLCLKGLYQT